jgi:hypothetical protein
VVDAGGYWTVRSDARLPSVDSRSWISRRTRISPSFATEDRRYTTAIYNYAGNRGLESENIDFKSIEVWCYRRDSVGQDSLNASTVCRLALYDA